MNTPIADFLENYVNSNPVRLHMPGHKGKDSFEKYDITEIDGADVLYNADGIIKESERNAAGLFGAHATFYSAEGSTLCIKAMLALVTAGKKTKRVLAFRNAHKAFVYACGLLDIEPVWMYPNNRSNLCECVIFPDEVNKKLSSMPEKPQAVYITSPDYLGGVADIKGISEICKKHDVPLLVDNAHGAYTAFTKPCTHPIHLGADMCCDSAHKTLPVLTGGAYLHLGTAAKCYADKAENALSIFASTSPSYLILRSLDLCNKYLAEGYEEKLSLCIPHISKAKEQLINSGFSIFGDEKLKLCISALNKGYTGLEIASILKSKGIYAEYSDYSHVVFMITPQNNYGDLEPLIRELCKLNDKQPLCMPRFEFPEGRSAMSIRQALLAEYETVDIAESVNRICAGPSVSCPPAIPIAVCGEIITEETIKLFEFYGTNTVNVVK